MNKVKENNAIFTKNAVKLNHIKKSKQIIRIDIMTKQVNDNKMNSACIIFA